MRIGALLLGLLSSLLVAGPATGPAAGAAAASDELLELVDHDAYFSPNGDGTSDRARVFFRLSHRSYVTVLVRDANGTAVRRAALGVQEARRHVWRWDGRSSAGGVLPDGRYRVILRAWGDEGTSRQSASTVAVTHPDAGRLVLSRPTVHPAATAVVDSLAASYVRAGFSEQQRLYGAYYGDRPIRLTARFVVVDSDGVKVLERTSTKYRPDFSWTARNAAGRPLEPGAYTLRVRITDEAGNARTIRRGVVVSDAQLTERLWTVTIPAASADRGQGPVYDPSCLGCGEVCGPVPSDRFPDGLSFRQPCSFGYAAVEYFAAAPPDVPAPVDAYRVSATGGPTTPGDSDVAHFDDLVLGPGDATATTPWEQVDLDAYPYLPDAGRPMRWAVSTSQENDYDISTFTLEYRYYVPVL
jgi:flagellar hook assembly protein FlgD